MAEDEQPDRRQSLLAFVESHWGELSLRDARALTVEFVESMANARMAVEEPLGLS